MRAFILIAFVAASSIGADTGAKRFASFLDAFNSKDRAKVESYIKAEFDPNMFEGRSVKEWTDQTLDMARDLAPLKTVRRILDVPTTYVAEVKAANGANLGIRLDLSPSAPHKIVGIRIDESAESLAGVKPKDYSDYASLEDLATRIKSVSKVPAIAIATIKDGKLEAAVAGIRKVGNPEPVSLGDRWLIGSNAKSMTSVLIATLIEEGKLSWDSKLGDLLPELPMKETYKSATVEQLMQHISVVQRDMTFTGAEVHRIAGNLSDPIAIRAAYVKDVLNREPIGKPGEKFAYSNAGYSILGHLAERICKRPFPELMRERVFKPLGLESAMVGQPGEDGMPGSAGQPHGHYKVQSGFTPGKLTGQINHMMCPAGGGVAISIEDMAKYIEWHMKGYNGEKSTLLKPETIRRLHAPLLKGQGQESYASGWRITDENGSMGHTHMGSDGSMVALMTFYPKQKLAVVVIVNAGLEQATVAADGAIAKKMLSKRR